VETTVHTLEMETFRTASLVFRQLHRRPGSLLSGASRTPWFPEPKATRTRTASRGSRGGQQVALVLHGATAKGRWVGKVPRKVPLPPSRCPRLASGARRPATAQVLQGPCLGLHGFRPEKDPLGHRGADDAGHRGWSPGKDCQEWGSDLSSLLPPSPAAAQCAGAMASDRWQDYSDWFEKRPRPVSCPGASVGGWGGVGA
jgi:hypothetical protein